MKFWLMLGAVLLAGLLQGMLPAALLLGQAKPPLLAGLVVYYALARPRRDVLWLAVLAGLVQDGLGRIPFGYSSFVFCGLGMLIAHYKDLVFVHETLTHLLFGALMGLLSTLAMYLLLTGSGLLVMPWGAALHKALGSAALGAVLTPFLFIGCARLDEVLGFSEEAESTRWSLGL
jgi:rod shape-determining protein MreD